MQQKQVAEIFQYPFSELDISLPEVSKVMGYKDPDTLPHPVFTAFTQLQEMLSGSGSISVTSIIEPVVIDSINKSIRCAQLVFETGKIVTHQLRNAEKAAWFISTAGHELSEKIPELFKQGEDIRGYTLDVLLNLYLEKAMDRFQENLLAREQKYGLQITNRYSPGYCEWDVSEQQKLFSLFPDEIPGVTLSASCLMIPVKSISGVIGIGKDVRFHPYACSICNDKNCLYRKTRDRTG